MRKKIIICALSVLLLILSGVLAFYLHGQNRPIAGLSGDNRTLLRVWMLHSPGGAARWVETQLSAYERQHPGMLIYLRQVSADELTAEGFICKGYKANVLDAEALEAVHQQVLADLGPCDILINGAGGNNPRATTDNEYQHEAKEGQKTFFDLEPNGVDFVFKLNFQGTLLPTQAFAKDMVARKSGNILNISSMNAYIPLTKIPAYSGAKAAISNFTQWLATHFAGTGIRANAIAPGFLVSNQNRALLFNADGTPTARSAKILNGTPMGRFVDSKELLGGVFFLTDDEAASAITGVVLPIDCGFAAYSGV